MPPKAKPRNAPNQHDKRHENGLAPPGKRVTKQRSNGHLNGQPNGKPASAITPPALPSTGLNQGFKFPRPVEHPPPDAASAASSSPSSIATAGKHDAAALAAAERARTNSDASLDDMAPDALEPDHRLPDLVPPPAAAAAALRSRSASYNPSRTARPARSLAAVSTILTYYPLRDAIAILILLLSLPPTLVLVIQALFASLTFVPPTAGLSLSTLPNVKEIFSSTNMGAPALITIFMVDLIFWACWAGAWQSVKNVSLDLSQAVIAVSLSGAAASASGPTYSIATCSLIVCVVHVLRYKAIHLTALDYLRSIVHKVDIGVQFDLPSFVSSFHPFTPPEQGWLFGLFRVSLGIHIVSQGVTTCIRRLLVKANERDANVPHASRLDTEAAANGAEQSARSSLGASDGAQHLHAALSSSDGRPPGLPPAHRENRLRELSSKKKRKQANLVRSQQPLWAAIASTKVTFVKEMEQRDAVDDAREATEMYNSFASTSSLAGATSSTTTIDRIWICDMRDTEVYFCVELSPESAEEQSDNPEENTYVGAGIDRTKPFFIRINGAAWSSARIVSASGNGADQEGKSSLRYIGEVFGLAPLSSYVCEVVGMSKQNTLCSVGLVTLPAPTAEQAASIVNPPHHPALRPSSPISTLRQSIQSAEAKLAETRNRTKKSKKDQRAAHSDIKKEINTLRQKLETSGGTDDRQKSRLLQIKQHKTQAEDATADLKGQIDALGDMPAEELQEADARKQAWKSALDARDAANEKLSLAKLDRDREIAALKTDICTVEAKKERLAARNAQRTQELEKLSHKQQAELSLRQKREQERAQIARERERKETELRIHTQNMLAEAQMYNQKTLEIQQQCAALAPNSSAWSSAPLGGQPAPGLIPYQSPPTPEGMLPGSTHGAAGLANGNAVSAPHQMNGFTVTASAGNVNAVPSFSHFGPVGAFSASFHPSQNSTSFSHSSSLAPPFLASSSSIAGTSSLAIQPSATQRGRSSSMLSQYSGFTDADDAEFLPPTTKSVFPGSMAVNAAANANASAAATTMDFRHQPTPWPLPSAVSAPSVLEDSRRASDADQFTESVGFNVGPNGGANGFANGTHFHLQHNLMSSASPRPEAKPFVPAAAAAVAATKAVSNGAGKRSPVTSSKLANATVATTAAVASGNMSGQTNGPAKK